MTDFEYTIEIGFDNHVSAGYASFVAPTPEEAVALRGEFFHPDCDTVVRREVGTDEWGYHAEDQIFDYSQKLVEYRLAAEKRRQRREEVRPKQSSALPNNRRVRTGGKFIRAEESLSIWHYDKGKFDVIKNLPTGF